MVEMQGMWYEDASEVQAREEVEALENEGRDHADAEGWDYNDAFTPRVSTDEVATGLFDERTDHDLLYGRVGWEDSGAYEPMPAGQMTETERVNSQIESYSDAVMYDRAMGVDTTPTSLDSVYQTAAPSPESVQRVREDLERPAAQELSYNDAKRYDQLSGSFAAFDLEGATGEYQSVAPSPDALNDAEAREQLRQARGEPYGDFRDSLPPASEGDGAS